MGSCVWHCVCPSHPACGPIPWLKCVHVSVHANMSTWLPKSASPHLNSYGNGKWKPGCPCVTLCVCVCPSHHACGPTPWLKSVHASVHANMSTWLPMSALPLLHSYMQTWVSLCGTACLLQSTHSFFSMCTYILYVLISTWLPMSATPPWNRGLTSKWRSHL